MNLTSILLGLVHQKYDELYENEAYQTVTTAEKEAEMELIQALTRKQRRLFHAYLEKLEAKTELEMRLLLGRCKTSVLLEASGEPGL